MFVRCEQVEQIVDDQGRETLQMLKNNFELKDS